METSTAVGWTVAIAVLVAAALAAPVQGRPWARRAVALLLLYLIVLLVAAALLPAAWAPWGVALAPAAVLLTVQPFIALGVLTHSELGLREPQSGTLRVVVTAIGLALAVNVAIMLVRGAQSIPMGAAVVASLLLAAVLEELVFRGVLLALLDRALPPRWNVLGAPIGWGGLALTAAFIALHGVQPGLLLGVVPAAILYLWLRARTGSLLAPIAAHLAWNLSVIAVH